MHLQTNAQTTQAAPQTPSEVNYDEAKMPTFELPDVLTDTQGVKIETANHWLRHRPNLVKQFETHMFGKRPETEYKQRYSVRSLSQETFGNDVTVEEIQILLSCEGREHELTVLLFLPKTDSPVPVFVAPNFMGNHTVSLHPEVSITETWVPNRGGVKDNKASEAGRGMVAERWPIQEITSAGFGLATIYSGNIDEDYDDQFAGGVHQLLGGNNKGSDWATISAWAWGLSRVADYLESDKRIDEKKMIVAGHSRLGKTALWAGATDTRFAAVISNDSGCGGAALSRRRIGESVARINTAFPHWFNHKFKDYNDNEDQCPVDQHMLIALMAPRPVYIASASEDLWADPKGEFLSGVYATPVYKLFGTEGLATDKFPEVQTPVDSVIGHHIRDGKHDITLYDWQQYLSWAKKHLVED